jgi:hypothetical protein
MRIASDPRRPAMARRTNRPRFCVEALEDRWLLSSFTVTNTQDGDVNLAQTLRWAINQVNTSTVSGG